MEDVGLIWNPKKCAVAHFKRGVRVPESTGLLMFDENVKIPTLEEGQQYKFLGVLETLRQEEKIVLRCAAREYLRRLSVIWSQNRNRGRRKVSLWYNIPVIPAPR